MGLTLVSFTPAAEQKLYAGKIKAIDMLAKMNFAKAPYPSISQTQEDFVSSTPIGSRRLYFILTKNGIFLTCDWKEIISWWDSDYMHAIYVVADRQYYEIIPIPAK